MTYVYRTVKVYMTVW